VFNLRNCSRHFRRSFSSAFILNLNPQFLDHEAEAHEMIQDVRRVDRYRIAVGATTSDHTITSNEQARYPLPQIIMIMDEINKLEACIQKLLTEREVELESRRRMSSDPRRKHSFGQFEIIKISEWVGKK
jgi:hypothetical protein